MEHITLTLTQKEMETIIASLNESIVGGTMGEIEEDCKTVEERFSLIYGVYYGKDE